MKQAKLEDATMLKCNNAEMQHQEYKYAMPKLMSELKAKS